MRKIDTSDKKYKDNGKYESKNKGKNRIIKIKIMKKIVL
jgi:hypothetical protein